MAEYIWMARGFWKKRWEGWEQTRAICYTIASANSQKRLPAIEKWWPLPSDKEKQMALSEDEMAARWERLKQKENG